MFTVPLLAEVDLASAQFQELKTMLDQSWVLLSAGLVLLMQGGFLCLESGLSRAKNSIHVAVKNLSDFCVSMVFFWACGYALMFGATQSGWFGTSGWFFSYNNNAPTLAFFLFQITFCGTATTIVSGAVAERMRFGGYLFIAAIVSGVIYPFYGHWAWGGATGGQIGWLAAIGFIDFAGSSVVHSVGGWVALAVTMVIGPRIGRFGKNSVPINGSNLPLAMLGVVLLWFGWFGFNGGSTLEMNTQTPLILANTCIAAGFGGLTGLLLSRLRGHWILAGDIINGVIAGLVGITAGCHLLTPASAALVGVIASVICFYATRVLERFLIDDAVAAFPAHGAAGIWGTLAVALLADSEKFANGFNRWEQLQIQTIGVVVCFVWSFGLAYIATAIVHRYWSLRVTAEAEIQGLNVAEHGATTEVIDLLSHMQNQRGTGDFSQPVPVEPNTEVGQIAASYNQVLQRVNQKTDRLNQARIEADKLHGQLVDAAHNAGKAEIATEVLHNVGNVLNSVNISAGIVMERIDESRAGLIQQVADLIEEHLERPEEFFSESGRGRKVPSFLSEVANALQEDQQEAIAELRQLMENLDHIKAIVSTQQSYAGMASLHEPVDLSRLIREAETLNESSFGRHSVDIIYDVEQLPEVILEKQKVLQILVNLLKNAKESLVSSRIEDRQIDLIVRRWRDRFTIEVTDNGMGIEPDNLTKIFNHGFTTKEDGHGFGLHSCANAAKAMGGSLNATSEGKGYGATFTLELPFRPAEKLVGAIS